MRNQLLDNNTHAKKDLVGDLYLQKKHSLMTKEKVNTSFRFSEKLCDQLTKEATRLNVSKNKLVESICMQYLT